MVKRVPLYCADGVPDSSDVTIFVCLKFSDVPTVVCGNGTTLSYPVYALQSMSRYTLTQHSEISCYLSRTAAYEDSFHHDCIRRNADKIHLHSTYGNNQRSMVPWTSYIAGT